MIYPVNECRPVGNKLLLLLKKVTSFYRLFSARAVDFEILWHGILNHYQHSFVISLKLSICKKTTASATIFKLLGK